MGTQSNTVCLDSSIGSGSLLQREFDRSDIKLNGARPFDIQIKDHRALDRIVTQGSLGLGESYMDGQWDCERVDMLVDRLLCKSSHERFTATGASMWLWLLSRAGNLQSRSRAFIVGERHYDIGNELYELMLDPYMNYSCGYWDGTESLEQAQINKMELICQKLRLAEGMRVLDIGCGWCGFARYAIEHYGVHVVGLTISKEQQRWASTHYKNSALEVHCQDYRDIQGTFDRIVSIGMFEHVGSKNYTTFFKKCNEILNDQGLMLLHTIGGNTSQSYTDPWLDRYIFPNGELPSIAQVGRAIEPFFIMEDWHNFGADYDRTLIAWYSRTQSAWSQLGDRYDERFQRMWTFYLLACAGAFRSRNLQLWQLVLWLPEHKRV